MARKSTKWSKKREDYNLCLKFKNREIIGTELKKKQQHQQYQ